VKRLGRPLFILLVLLAAILLVGPLLIPVSPPANTRPPQELADPDSHFIQLGDVNVHYKRVGEGERALILLHGFAASTFSWREVMEPLAQSGSRYQVVAFDRPAFGLTSRPMPDQWTAGNPYRPEAQVALTIALMDELGLDSAVLVGNSAGGSVAMAAALRYPERFEALVLVDPAVYVGANRRAWLRPLLRTPQMRRIGPLLVRNIQDWGEDFGRSAWHDPERITPQIWEGYRKPLQADNWDRALWEYAIAAPSINLPEHLDQLQLPILVITGDDDRIVPTDHSIRLAGELPQAELVVISDCGHVPHEECPEPFLEAVHAFLEAVSPFRDTSQ
jgi:pimeloyl-ACP methyl ester carboxylesterase